MFLQAKIFPENDQKLCRRLKKVNEKKEVWKENEKFQWKWIRSIISD